MNPDTEQFWIIDYRIFDPDKDEKTKVQHVREMLDNLVYHKKLPFKTVLMDSGYANYPLMLYIHHLNKLFYCALKNKRLAKVPDADAVYQHLSTLAWEDGSYKKGQLIPLKNMPKEIPLKLFSISVSTNRIDYVVTHDVERSCADDTKKICAIRWYVERFHREIKQLNGIEQCQCRRQRIQRNHIACAKLIWAFLKKTAYQTGKTVYQLKQNLLKKYLTTELSKPQLKFRFA